MKKLRIPLIVSILFLSACGGGSSSSERSAEAAMDCVSGTVSNGTATLTNVCDIDVNVRIFNNLSSSDAANNQPVVLVPANETISGVPAQTFGSTIAACSAPTVPVFETQDFFVAFVECV